jgi:uncharacterized membrane protein YphA (DoxX/SURF4 family)
MFDFAGRPLRAMHSSWRSIDAAALVIRAALGVGFIAHGGQKLFGWFGGTGITGTTASAHWPGALNSRARKWQFGSIRKLVPANAVNLSLLTSGAATLSRAAWHERLAPSSLPCAAGTQAPAITAKIVGVA